MTIASFDKFIEPLLRLLAEHPNGLATAEAQRLLAAQFDIGPDQKRELLPSGTYPVYKSRIGWAHDRLKRDGLSTSLRRGFWQITDKGMAYARANPTLDANELKRLAYPNPAKPEPNRGGSTIVEGNRPKPSCSLTLVRRC